MYNERKKDLDDLQHDLWICQTTLDGIDADNDADAWLDYHETDYDDAKQAICQHFNKQNGLDDDDPNAAADLEIWLYDLRSFNPNIFAYDLYTNDDLERGIF
jgi:hypothetical protein